MSGRYAMNEKGESLTLEEFFNLVSQKAITHDDLQNLSVRPLKQKKATFDGPPCIEILQNMGIFEGSRDDVVFHYCVYAKKKWGQGDWQNKVFEFNTAYCKPPMSYDQVKQKIETK